MYLYSIVLYEYAALFLPEIIFTELSGWSCQ